MSISAILSAAVACFLMSPLWYGVWGRAWAKESNVSPTDRKRRSPKALGISGLTALLSALGIAYLIQVIAPDHIGGAMGLGLTFWALFSSATLARHYAFLKKTSRHFWIDTGYDAVSFVLMSAIIFGMS